MLENCKQCKHYVGRDDEGKYVCKAYLNGIPDRIKHDELVHDNYWLQDTPYLFTPKGGSSASEDDVVSRRKEVHDESEEKEESTTETKEDDDKISYASSRSRKKQR